MGHRYYQQDFEANNFQRLEYFDSQFLSLANEVASAKGVTLNNYLSQIKNLSTFKEILQEVFSQDPSLSDYVGGMDSIDYELFFNRTIIQDFLEAEEVPEEIPVDVEQVEKETRRFFRGTYTDKKTGKIRRTVGFEVEFIRNGKRQTRLKDSSGRFIKKLK